jgi:hypothetical protein
VHRTGGRKVDHTAGRAIDLIMIHAVMSRSDSYANITHFRYSLRKAG